MDFGEALKLLKSGKKVARKGWNAKNLYVFYIPNTESKEEYHGKKVMLEPYLVIKNAKETLSTWTPSIGDCLGEDWMEVK